MSVVSDIDDALLLCASTALGATLRAYLPLPGGLPQLAAVLAAQIVTPPCLFSAWRGSERRIAERGGQEVMDGGLRMRSTWSMLAVTQHPAGELGRRRGSTQPAAIGAYAIAERVAAALHDHTLAGVGTCRVTALIPLESQALTDLAVTIVEIRLTLDHDMDTGLDLDVLDDFLRFEGTIDLAPADGHAEVVARWEREDAR